MINNGIKRLLKLSAVLIFLGTFVIIVFGYFIKRDNAEIKTIEKFVESASDLQTNFERSLQLYVEETQEITKFLLAIRPSGEAEYIKFISEIERIGKNLSLDLNLQYLKAKTPVVGDPKTLDYQIALYGNQSDLIKFLAALEALPYYIRIENLSFTNPGLITEKETLDKGNVNIAISLYIK